MKMGTYKPLIKTFTDKLDHTLYIHYYQFYPFTTLGTHK